MKKALQWFDENFEKVLMAVFLSGIVIMMSTHVFFRYVMKSPLTWTEEATRYMFIWFVFMGISFGIKNETHVRVNIIEIIFPKVIPVLHWFQDIVSALFIFYLIPAGYSVVGQVASRGQTSAGLHLPMSFVYGALEIGLILAAIRIVQKFYLKIRQIIENKHNKLERGDQQ